jgi:hypothetical protein
VNFPSARSAINGSIADAHILIAFLACCLQVTLKQRLLLDAPGLTPAAVLEKLAEIKRIDVWIPTVDQRWLILPRYTQASPDTKLLIEKLKCSCRVNRHRVWSGKNRVM